MTYYIALAIDINAACSGWLYGLQYAFDFLSNSPRSTVLLVTSETLSEVVDFSDAESAPLFGDAASATLLSNNRDEKSRLFKLFRPSLASILDPDGAIKVPLKNNGEKSYLSIQGRRVFNVAVKAMSFHLVDYANNNAIDLNALDWVVSHQANDRIIYAVKNKLHLDNVSFISNIKHSGNTSSSSIPLAIDQNLVLFKPNQKIGLVAFGGGFTLGSALLQVY